MISIPRLSPNLEKARTDHWNFAVGLKSGIVFYCTRIRFCPDGVWAMLLGSGEPRNLKASPDLPDADHFVWGRSVDVRIADISFVGDCDS